MRNMRRMVAALVALPLIALAGCASETPSTGAGDGDSSEPALQSPTTGLDGRAFVSTDVNRRGKPYQLASKAPIRLAFAGTTLNASAGCNQLSGESTLQGDQLLTEPMSTTDMGCGPRLMRQDEWLVDFLTSQPSITVDANRITLSSGQLQIELLDEEVAYPDLPLTDTRWVLESFGDAAGGDDSVSTGPTRRPSTLQLTREQLTFDDTCNVGSARVIIEGSMLVVDRLLTTLVGCPRGGVSSAVSNVLRDQVKYFIEGDQLVLTRGNASLTYRGH